MTSREHLAILSRLEQAELKLNQLWQAHNSAEKDLTLRVQELAEKINSRRWWQF